MLTFASFYPECGAFYEIFPAKLCRRRKKRRPREILAMFQPFQSGRARFCRRPGSTESARRMCYAERGGFRRYGREGGAELKLKGNTRAPRHLRRRTRGRRRSLVFRRRRCSGGVLCLRLGAGALGCAALAAAVWVRAAGL